MNVNSLLSFYSKIKKKLNITLVLDGERFLGMIHLNHLIYRLNRYLEHIALRKDIFFKNFSSQNYLSGCCITLAKSSTAKAEAIIDNPGLLTVHC